LFVKSTQLTLAITGPQGKFHLAAKQKSPWWRLVFFFSE